MSIVLARVNNRLVHGQILATWVPALDADGILVLDDEAAGSELVKGAMEIAIPPEVQFEIAPVDQTQPALARFAKVERLIVIVRDVAELTRALDAGLKITRLNLGNVHHDEGRIEVSPAVYLSLDEVEELRSIEKRGIAVELKTLPNDSPVTLAQIRRIVEQSH